MVENKIKKQETVTINIVENALNNNRRIDEGKIILFPSRYGERFDAEQFEPIDCKMKCTRLLEFKMVEKSEKDFNCTTVIDESKIIDLHNISIERNLPIYVIFLFIDENSYYIYNINEIEEFPIFDINTKRVQFSTISEKVTKNVYRVPLKKENRFEIK